MEPDLLKNSHVVDNSIKESHNYSSKVILLRNTDQLHELQTILRDKYVISSRISKVLFIAHTVHGILGIFSV